MPTKSSSNYAILGLLAIRPMTAYEIVKFSKETIGFFWNESYGNIYSILKKLLATGHIHLLEEINQGRRRKTYAITDRGIKNLKEWLNKPAGEIILRDELLLKIFISEKEDIPYLYQSIQQEENDMKQALDALDQVQQGIDAVDHDPVRKKLWLLTLEYGKQFANARYEWCQKANDLLKQIVKEM